MRPLPAICLIFFLCACTLPSVRSQAISRVSPPLEPVGTYSLVGDPNFSPDQLPAEMQEWRERMIDGFDKAIEIEGLNNPVGNAMSGDLYEMGRFLNVYITSLLTALRVTGDLTFLDEADRLMEMARLELADYNGDGFRNWRYLHQPCGTLCNDDYHEMDEILTHSLVAAVAAALKANEKFDPRYGEHAAFWTDYLQNDFEEKWRRREDKPEGLPVVDFSLMHPYVQYIRYHHYMYQLTGDPDYKVEAERRANLVNEQVREIFTAGGPGYVWDQRFLPDFDASKLSCQNYVYLQYTFQAFQDLALEGIETFDTAFMQRVATTMAEVVMEDSYRKLAPDICGGVPQRDLFSNSRKRGITFHFVNFPFAAVGKWDASGKIEQAVRNAYDEIDFSDFHYTLATFNLSAQMLLLLANDPDSR